MPRLVLPTFLAKHAQARSALAELSWPTSPVNMISTYYIFDNELIPFGIVPVIPGQLLMYRYLQEQEEEGC